MIQWLKYLILGIGFAMLILFGGNLFMQHSSNVKVAQEIQESLSASIVSSVRDGKSDNTLETKEVVANIIAAAVSKQKNHGNDIGIRYSFLDQGGKTTDREELIQSIQFQIELLDKDKKVDSQTTFRLELKGGA